VPPATREALLILARGPADRAQVAAALEVGDNDQTRNRRAASLLATLQKKGLADVKGGKFVLSPDGRKLVKQLQGGKRGGTGTAV
jgi:hypothetical protein